MKPMNTPEQNAVRGAHEAARVGWYTADAGGFLVAINPHDSSEIWMFFGKENEWRRKGEKPCKQLPLAKAGAQ